MMLLLPPLLRSWAEAYLTNNGLHNVEIAELKLNIFSGHIEVEDIRVRSYGDQWDLIVIPKLTADVALWPLLKHKVVVEELEIESPHVRLLQSEEGGWDLPVERHHSSVDSSFESSLDIQHAVLRDGILTVESRLIVPAQTDRLTRIQLTLTGSPDGHRAPTMIQGTATVPDSGMVVVEGAMLSHFRSGTIKLDLSGISLARLQRYFGNHPSVRGLIDARLSIEWPGKGPSLVWISGSIEGHNLVWASGDRPAWRVAGLSISQFDAMWPGTVTLNRVVVKKPDIWVRRNENGRFVGVGGVAGHSSTPSAPSRSTHARYEIPVPTRWVINTLIVQEGTIHFEDRSVTPRYSDLLQNLALSLDKLMSDPPHPVTITARADIASGGTVDMYGRMSLFDPLPSASLKAAIHQLVVPSTNPYVEHTLSHHTTDGRLTSVMDIRLSGTQLDVTSHVVLSDLQVEPVRNPTSRSVEERIGLPLGLLIALLKDDMGRITISFPISGPLSNPTFDWTNALWATIRHAIIKLVALPIRSLGRFVMGNQQSGTLPLGPITFDPGSTIIRPTMERKLHDLGKLLGSTNRTILRMTPILSATDLEALQHLPHTSWPIPGLDTPETAGHVLAVRRAYLVATLIAGLHGISSDRLPVNPPRRELGEAVIPRVELQIEDAETSTPTGALPRKQD